PQLRPPAPGQVYIHMRKIEVYYRQLLDRGARITLPLALRPWGMKDFRVVDPDGNQLGFAEVSAP
ncbi:MAG: VOC family protein, partial [Limisphaerales bacterium]